MQKYKKNLSLWEVSLAVANSMIGLSLLYFPQLFLDSGIVVGVLALIVLSIMMSYTCSLWSQHLLHDEMDIGQVVLRVLKKTMFIIFSLSSGIALCLLTTTIFLMINQLVYILLIQIFDSIGASFHYRRDTNQIHFEEFSIQYLGIILIIPLGLLLSLKNIDKILSITKYASLLMVVFIIQVVIFFAENVITKQLKQQEIKLYPSQFSQVVNLFSTVLFALISHPSVSPILKNSKNPLSNSKSIYLGYLLTFILFILIGIFGGIGLIGRQCLQGNTVISYFVGSVLSYTMTIPVLLYLLCIFAIYPYVARNQVLGLIEFFTNNPFTKRKYHYHFSFILILFLLVSIFINLNPAIIISFIGSVMCWLSCFLFPCIIRLKQGKPKYDIQSLISEQQLIPKRARVSIKQKIWIGIVITSGTVLMLSQFYYIIQRLI